MTQVASRASTSSSASSRPCCSSRCHLRPWTMSAGLLDDPPDTTPARCAPNPDDVDDLDDVSALLRGARAGGVPLSGKTRGLLIGESRQQGWLSPTEKPAPLRRASLPTAIGGIYRGPTAERWHRDEQPAGRGAPSDRRRTPTSTESPQGRRRSARWWRGWDKTRQIRLCAQRYPMFPTAGQVPCESGQPALGLLSADWAGFRSEVQPTLRADLSDRRPASTARPSKPATASQRYRVEARGIRRGYRPHGSRRSLRPQPAPARTHPHPYGVPSIAWRDRDTAGFSSHEPRPPVARGSWANNITRSLTVIYKIDCPIGALRVRNC